MPHAQGWRSCGRRSPGDWAFPGRVVYVFVAIWLSAFLGFAGATLAADPESIFRPAPIPAQPTDWVKTLTSAGLLDFDKIELSGILSLAEQRPSMGTALAVMAQTARLTPAVREKINSANRFLLPMADLARHQLTIETNLALNGGATGQGIAAVSRVGSSARRHMQWLAWSRDSNGDWNHLPFDSTYFTNEVGSSDDDLTNWATPEALAKNPAAHELVNGKFAQDRFNALAAAHLKAAAQGLPDSLRAYLAAVDAASATKVMKVGFLSPPQLWLRALPKAAQNEFLTAPNDLLALLKADVDKYSGAFFEDQIHQWGRDKGVVTENVADPASSTVSYERSLVAGKLLTLVGELPADGRRLDPLGWVSNNYRQSFLTHQGKLREVAKYTLRILAYWEHTSLNLADAIEQTRDVPGFGAPVMVEDTKRLAQAIYKPDSYEALESAIAGVGGEIEASRRLKDFQMRLLIAAHRRHVQVVFDELVTLVRTRQIDTSQGLTFNQLRGLAGDDKSYYGFDRSLDALASAYANLPPDALAVIANDLGRYVEKNKDSDKPAEMVGVTQRAALIGVLNESLEVAREAGQVVTDQTGAVTQLQALAKDKLGRAISEELVRMSAPDLDVYLLEVFAGKTRKKRLTVMSETRRILGKAITYPVVREVDAHWGAEDVAADMDRIKRLGEFLGWSNLTYAQNIHDYFRDEPSVTMGVIKIIGEIYDPTKGRSQHVEYENEGQRRSLTIDPSRPVDVVLNTGRLAVNTGHMALIGIIKGSEPIKKAWDHWGDVNNVIELSKNMRVIFFKAINDPTKREDVAKAEFAALSLFVGMNELPERYLRGQWKTNLESVIGGKSILTKGANTAQGVIKLATDMRFTQDEAAELAYAAIKDGMLAWEPDLAIVMALHGIYSAVSSTVISTIAKDELLSFFVQNGDWEFPENGGEPKLKSVYAYGRSYTENAEERAKTCRERWASGPRQSPRPPVGVEAVLRSLNPTDDEQGTSLCKRVEKGQCLDLTGTRVQPRKLMLKLFKDGRFFESDVIQQSNVDAIKQTVDWKPLQRIWDFVGGADPETWTKAWLEKHGITVPTPEDSPDFITGKIVIKPRTDVSWYEQSFSAGAQSSMGYLVSQYWTRRQDIMECQLLDPVIKEAGRLARRSEVERGAPSDYVKQLAQIDARIASLDDRIWPEIADSSEPYDWKKPPAKKRRILQDFRQATANQRLYLRALQNFLDSGTLANIPWDAMSVSETATQGNTQAASDAQKLEYFTQLANYDARQSIVETSDLATAYEDAYDGALATMGEMQSKAEEAEGFTLKPYHIAFFELDSYRESPSDWSNPMEDLPGKIEVPRAAFNYSRLARWPNLLNVKTVTKAWVMEYRDAIERARDDLAAVMARFKERITPLSDLTQLAFNPMSGFLEWNAADLAVRHPLWPKQLRLAMQNVKIDQAIRYQDRMSPEDVKRLEDTFKLYDHAASSERSGLAGSRDKGQARYRKHLEFAARMFDLKLSHTPEDKDRPTLLDELLFKAESSVIPETLFTPEEIKGWSKKHIWEIVQEERSPEWSGADPGDETLTKPACQYDSRDPAFPDNVAAQDSKDKPEQRYAPLKSGRYKVRLTVLAAGDVPMSQEEVIVQIEPGRITGTVMANGLHLEQAVIDIHLNERFAVASKTARFEIPAPGPFEAWLCEFHAFEITRTTPEGPRVKTLAEIGGFFDADARALIAGQPDFPSGRVDVVLLPGEKAHFELIKPLVLELDQWTTIDVKVTDVTRSPVTDAEIKVTARSAVVGPDGFGIRDLPGPVPVSMDLSRDDQVTAKAKVKTDDGVAEGETEVPYIHKFDPAKLETLATAQLKVTVPFYEANRLSVSGRFVESSEPVGGGVIRSSSVSVKDKTIPIGGGGTFEIVNFGKRVLLDKDITFETLLFDSSPEKWLLRPGDGNFRAPMQERQDGAVDLGDIAVTRATLKPVEVVVGVVDAAGAPISGDKLKVTFEDRPMDARGPEKFQTDWAVAKWDEEATAKARFHLSDNTILEGTHTFTVADIGDRFDPKDPKPVEMQLPVYQPDGLTFIWQGHIEGETGSVPAVADFLVKTSDPEQEEGSLYGLGREIKATFPIFVRAGGDIEITAEASDEHKRYRGSLMAVAPPVGVKEARLGDVALRAFEGIVPDVAGMTEPQARTELEKSGLVLVVVPGDKVDSDHLAGRAYDQEPQAGTPSEPAYLPIGQKVTVTFFAPKAKVDVPAVRGLPVEDAAAILENAGFTVKKASLGVAKDGQEPDIVTAQDPKPGAPDAKAGQVVTISYYEAPPPPPPPVVTDQPVGDKWAGPWRGTLAMTKIDAQMGTMRFQCVDAPSCPASLRAGLQTVLNTKEEAAIFLGLPPAIFAICAAAIELSMEGLEVSLGFAYDPAIKGYRPSIPGMPPAQAATSAEKAPPLVEGPPGVLKATVTYPGESGGKVDVELKLSPDGAKLEISVHADFSTKGGRVVADGYGAFVPGTINFQQVQADLDARYERKLKPYQDIVAASPPKQ